VRPGTPAARPVPATSLVEAAILPVDRLANGARLWRRQATLAGAGGMTKVKALGLARRSA